MPARKNAQAGRAASNFPEWLGQHLEERHIERKAIAAALDVRVSTVGRWLNGTWRPRPPRIPVLARFLQVDVEDIHAALGWEPTPRSEDPEWLRELFNQIRAMPLEDIRFVETSVATLNARRQVARRQDDHEGQEPGGL